MNSISHSLFHSDYKDPPYFQKAARPRNIEPINLAEETNILIVSTGYGGFSDETGLARFRHTNTIVDWLPHIGEKSGAHYCIGCDGSRVGIIPQLDQLFTLLTLKEKRSESTFFVRRLSRMKVACYAQNPQFSSLVGYYFRLRDRLERGQS